MSLMSYNQIKLLIQDGVIEGADEQLLNASSLDIRLGRKLLIERPDPSTYMKNQYRRISLKNREPLTMIEHDLAREGPYILAPGEFILAHSVEVFHLPNNISAEYKLKSSMARIALEHLNAGWCDAGWFGSVLTLELINLTRNHEIILEHNDLIGQMVFFLHEEVPAHASYAHKGRYNNDTSVSGAKTKQRMIAFGDQQQEVYQEQFNRDHPGNFEVLLNEPPRKVIEVPNTNEEGEV